MKLLQTCPECGAVWQDGRTCQEYFHQMLYWEAEDPSLGEVHRLSVLCNYLQHPSLYSLEGLEQAKSFFTLASSKVRPRPARVLPI